MPPTTPGNSHTIALSLQDRCIGKVYTNAARNLKKYDHMTLYDIGPDMWAKLNAHAEALECRYRRMFKVYVVAAGPIMVIPAMVENAPCLSLVE